MDIKGIHSYYQNHPIQNAKPTHEITPQKVEESRNTEQTGKNGIDTVSISSKGSFQSQINAEMKKYANAAKEGYAISPERLEALKRQYQGDRTPVSGDDIAKAILQRVCGEEVK